MLDAKERYYKFMREKPDLFNRIPQYYIAAYLGSHSPVPQPDQESRFDRILPNGNGIRIPDIAVLCFNYQNQI